ncbi:NIPSNAP family protein [Streptomyces spiralis]|uniref:NIPSNAP family protein n=1 Tax=Streptomyces spiralis TaxID=66376 RepID=UPI0036921228
MLAELRSYTITPGCTDALLEQFRAVSLPLFQQLGITVYGPWLHQLPKGQQFIYLLEFADARERDTLMDAFRSAPAWRVAQEARNGLIPLIAGQEVKLVSR